MGHLEKYEPNLKEPGTLSAQLIETLYDELTTFSFIRSDLKEKSAKYSKSSLSINYQVLEVSVAVEL